MPCEAMSTAARLYSKRTQYSTRTGEDKTRRAIFQYVNTPVVLIIYRHRIPLYPPASSRWARHRSTRP